MVLSETMNESDNSPQDYSLQLALVPLQNRGSVWNDNFPGGQDEGLPFLIFDDEDSEDDEDMNEDENFDNMDDDFDDDFDDDEDDFDDEDDDYEDEDDDYDYEEDVDYDDFDE